MTEPVPITGFLGLTSEGRAVVRQSTRCALLIYPQNHTGESILPKRRTDKPIIIDWDPGNQQAALQSFSYEKQMGQPGGRWVAQVKERPGQEIGLDNMAVLDGDWVDAYAVRNGVKIPILRGVVDSVRRQRTVGGNGATVTSFTITGRDHGAFFEYPITWTSFWVQTLQELAGGLFTSRVEGKIGGTPDEMFELLINATFKKGTLSGQWEVPKSLRAGGGTVKRLIDVLKLVPLGASRTNPSNGLRGGSWNELQLWTSGGQNLHQALQQWCNPLLNEVYYDLLMPAKFVPKNQLQAFAPRKPFHGEEGIRTAEPTKLGGEIDFESEAKAKPTSLQGGQTFIEMAAFIRERPFMNRAAGDLSMWTALPTWRIPSWTLIAEDLGRAGFERYNLFELLGDLGSASANEQAPMSPPVIYADNIRTHGLRVFSQTSNFMASANTGLGGWFKERKLWQDLLVDWWGPAPYLRQGTLTNKLFLPEVRLGQRLVVDSGGGQEEQFYIEGFQLSWEGPRGERGPSKGSTTWTVTRGYKGSDRELLADVTDIANRYKLVGEEGDTA